MVWFPSISSLKRWGHFNMATNFLGLGINTPTIDISGFISNTWVYVLIIAFIGFCLIASLALVMFFTTYSRKVEIYENIAGRGYQRTTVTRARILKGGIGGVEVLKTLKGGYYLSAYGSKMGRNLYWFAKGSDGYLYNIVLGDLDTKRAMLDIEPIDRDVRMEHSAINQMIQQTYGDKNTLQKVLLGIFFLALLIIFFVGMYINSGKLADTAKTNQIVATRLAEVSSSIADEISAYENIRRQTGIVTDTGLVPAG